MKTLRTVIFYLQTYFITYMLVDYYTIEYNVGNIFTNLLLPAELSYESY